MVVAPWHAIRAWMSAIGGAIAAGCTYYLGRATADSGFGTQRGRVVALTLIAVIAIVSSFARPIRVYFIDRIERQRRKAEDAMRALPWAVNELTGAPVRPLGASTWVVVGFWRFKRLYRLARERVDDIPTPSEIRWTKGKGVIGMCWNTGREQVIDTGSLYAEYAGCDQASWNMAPAEVRSGMSHRDFTRIEGKYGTVVAVPVTCKGEKVIGVVALDAPPGHHEELADPAVVEAVGHAAVVVANLLT